MLDPLDAVVLIPSLHPDHLLTDYADALCAQGFQRILVVDDGSGPEYAAWFDQLREKPGCTVIGYAKNGGKGHALKHGMRHILENFPDAPGVVTADSDGQHTAEDVLNCARAALASPETLVLGSRDFSGRDIPAKSRAGNRLTSLFFALLYGTWLPDTQTGLRAFTLDMVPFMLRVPGDRFEYEMNMLIACSNQHIPFEKVPIETIYIEENRRTHFRPFHDSVRIYRQLFGNFIKYASASGLSTVLDVALFTLMDKWLLPMTGLNPSQRLVWGITLHVLLAKSVARLASSVFNFKANKSFVFRVDKCKGAFGRYVVLVVGVLLLSSGLISTLNAWLGWDRVLLNILVDTALFFANYRLQRSWVFANRTKKG